MPKRPVEGRSAVTRRAISDIIRTAVRGSYGVAGFATPTPDGHLVRVLGLREPGIRLGGVDPLSVDLHIRVAFGLPIAEVARQIDSAVRYALQRDLGREVGEVTIHVDGLEYNPGRIPELPVADDEGVAGPSGPAPTAKPGATKADDDAAPAGVEPAARRPKSRTRIGGAA